jgi:hypothetical protein
MPTTVILVDDEGREYGVTNPLELVNLLSLGDFHPQTGTIQQALAALYAQTPAPGPSKGDRVILGDLQDPTSPARAALAYAGSGVTRALAGISATLQRAYRSTCLAAVGDSTGDNKDGPTGPEVDEWIRVLVRLIAAQNPAYTFQEPRWNDTLQGFDAPIVLQNGTGNGGGARRAVFAKATPGGLRYVGAAITGDISLRGRFHPTSYTPVGQATLIARWESTGNQRSVLLLLNQDGTLGLNWSADGTTSVGAKNSTVAVSTAPGFASGQPIHLRADLDVDNGATGNDLKFYTSTDGVTWTQLGATVTTAGVTSIFAGTAPWQIGSFTSGLTTPFDGSVYSVDIRPGLASQTSVVPRIVDEWDWYSAAATVTLAGAPVFTFLNGSQSGQGISYFDNATRRAILHQPWGQAAVIINDSHNDGTMSKGIWLSNYATMVNNIKSLLPNVPILAVAQNRVGVGGPYALTQQDVELRATRGAMLGQYTAAVAGVEFFDAWPHTLVSDTLDQLHLSTGPGSGSDKVGRAAFDRLANP